MLVLHDLRDTQPFPTRSNSILKTTAAYWCRSVANRSTVNQRRGNASMGVGKEEEVGGFEVRRATTAVLKLRSALSERHWLTVTHAPHHAIMLDGSGIT